MKSKPNPIETAVILIFACAALLSAGYLAKEHKAMAPPAEFVYWESTSPQKKAEKTPDKPSPSKPEEPSQEETIPAETYPVPEPEETLDSFEAEISSEPLSSLEEEDGFLPEEPPVKIYLNPEMPEEPFLEETFDFEEEFFPEEDFPQEPDEPLEPEIPADPDRLVNINTAGANELCTLNGIGEVLAQRIIEYRRENGGFQQIEDIMNVKGIAEGNFSKIQSRITV